MYIRIELHSPPDAYDGHDVYVEDQLIGHRPYDGVAYPDQIRDEVRSALAELLREKLGWNETAPEHSEN